MELQQLLEKPWVVMASEQGITASLLEPPPDSPCRVCLTKGEMVLTDFTPEDIISLMQTPSIRPRCHLI